MYITYKDQVDDLLKGQQDWEYNKGKKQLFANMRGKDPSKGIQADFEDYRDTVKYSWNKFTTQLPNQ